MDLEVESHVRLLRADDTATPAALRALVVLERAGRVAEAWDAGLALVARRRDRDGALGERLLGIARLSPGAIVARIRCARPGLARRAIELLDAGRADRLLVAFAMESRGGVLTRLALDALERRLRALGCRAPASPALVRTAFWLTYSSWENEYPALELLNDALSERSLAFVPWLVALSLAGPPDEEGPDFAAIAARAFEAITGEGLPYDEKRFLRAGFDGGGTSPAW